MRLSKILYQECKALSIGPWSNISHDGRKNVGRRTTTGFSAVTTDHPGGPANVVELTIQELRDSGIESADQDNLIPAA
jgi:hypothetical protein